MKCDFRFLTAAAVAAIPLLLNSASSQAATLISGSEMDPTAPIFTVDPDGERNSNPAARGIAEDRNLRQSFFYTGSEPLLVDDIRLSLNLESDQQLGGLEMRVYKTADVNSSTFVPTGSPLIDLVVVDADTPIPSTGDYAQIQLDTSDPNEQLILGPNRGFVFELSNNDDTTNIAQWRHTNAGPMDFYADGNFYTESGGQSGDGDRDAGLSMSGTIVPEPSSILLLAGCGSLMVLRRRR